MIAANDQDRALGMDYYITSGDGCSGELRSFPEDFCVEEVYEDFVYEGGRYLVLELQKTNWDTHHLIREMSRQLGISQKRFSWAGTKDKRAVTSQRISIMNLDESELEKITLPDVKIKVLGRTNRGISLGDLLGNRFRITIRDLSCFDANARMAAVTKEIQCRKGVPNYFGVQRFGDTRPVTHRVGEALVRGQIEEAVFIYLALPFAGEPERTRVARSQLWESRDINAALKSYPGYLRYELAMLNYLTQHPGDYGGSFSVLATNLRRLFVHAYQSYLFNRILSRRMEADLPLDRAAEGDMVCFSKGDQPDTSRLQNADIENLEAVNRLIERGRAFVTLPLIGFETSLAKGFQGEIEMAVMQDEDLKMDDFCIKERKDLGSRGARRAALLRVNPSISVEGECANLQFFLPAGGYATVVLREYLKSATVITEKPQNDLKTIAEQ
jgi:tRNA pseudouridine13 synthase